MSKLEHKGIIGFFDILGYSNLLENNDIGPNTEEVIDIILNAKSNIYKEYYTQSIKAKEIYDEYVRYIVISDSILFYSYYLNEDEIDVQWKYFLLYLNIFQKYMFDKGLPVRGVVNVGNYFIKENCFAGKTIIDAIKFSNRIKMAACALHEAASYELKNIDFSMNLPETDLSEITIDYPFIDDPLLNCISLNCPHIPKEALARPPHIIKFPTFLNMMVLKVIDKNINLTNYVSNSFSKYNKKIDSNEVRDKIVATTNFLEACRKTTE